MTITVTGYQPDQSKMKKILLFFLLIPFVVAVPGIPHQFYGSVNFTDGSTPDDLMVSAVVDGETVATGFTKDGGYGYSPYFFYVTDPDNDMQGKTISFEVAGVQAEQEAVFENNGYTELDFVVPGTVRNINKQNDSIDIRNLELTVTPANPVTVTYGEDLVLEVSSDETMTVVIERLNRLGDQHSRGKVFLIGYELQARTDAEVMATISYDVPGLDENTVAPYYFDRRWRTLSPYTIDKTANKVTFEVDGTRYALFADEAKQTTSSSSGSSGDVSADISDDNSKESEDPEEEIPEQEDVPETPVNTTEPEQTEEPKIEENVFERVTGSSTNQITGNVANPNPAIGTVTLVVGIVMLVGAAIFGVFRIRGIK